jgi:hypothetical protein
VNVVGLVVVKKPAAAVVVKAVVVNAAAVVDAPYERYDPVVAPNAMAPRVVLYGLAVA